MVILHTLGQCVIRTHLATITPRANVAFSLALHLIGERGRQIGRQALLGMFWPGATADDAGHNLREALRKLRQKGIPIHGENSPHISIPRDAAIIDVDQLPTRPPEELITLDYRILPDWTPTCGSPRLHDWVDDLRTHLTARATQAVADVLHDRWNAGDWTAVLHLAERVVELDPSHDEALAARSEAAAALRDRRGQRLGRSGMVPSVQVRELAVPSQGWGQPSGAAFSGDTKLVGRDGLIDAAAVTLDDVARASVLYFWGAPGIGKSRLCRSIASLARSRGMATVSVACQISDRGRPLAVFMRAVPLLRDLPGAAGCDPDALRFLDRLIHRQANPSAATAMDGALDLHERARQALVDLVDAITDEQPLLVVLEDLHWCDAQSWDLLLDLADLTAGHPVIFCATSRRELDQSCTSPRFIQAHQLEPLSDTAATEHVHDYAARLDVRLDGDHVARAVQLAEGNPLFLEELVRHWATTGDYSAVPGSIAALIESRIAHLSAPAGLVLSGCAILGDRATITHLQRLTGLGGDEFIQAVDELGQLGLVTDGDGPPHVPDCAIICRHDLIARAALTHISDAGLRALHADAARIIEEDLQHNDSATLLWDCASHWCASGASAYAVRIGISCAAHLLGVGLAEEAIAAGERTLALCSTDAERRLVSQALLRSFLASRRWKDAHEVAAALRSCEGASMAHDDVELAWQYAGWRGGEAPEPILAHALACVRETTAAPSHRVQAGILCLRMAFGFGLRATMEDAYRTVAPLLSAPDVSDVHRGMLEMIYNSVLGDRMRCAPGARTLIAHAEAEQAEHNRLRIVLPCIMTILRYGELGEGEDLLTSLFDRYRRLGMPTAAGEITQYLINRYLDRGDHARAADWADRYLALPAQAQCLWNQWTFRLNRARLEIWRGNFDEADALLIGDGPPMWDSPAPITRGSALAAKIRLEIARGATPSALMPWVHRLASVNAVFRYLGGQDDETGALALGYRYIGDSESASALIREYLSDDRRDTIPPPPELIALAAAK